MRTLKSLLMISLLICSVASCMVAAHEQKEDEKRESDDRRRGRNFDPEERARLSQEIFKKLNLSADQTREIKNITESTGKRRKAAKEQLSQAQEDLDREIYGPAPNEAAVRAKIQKVADAHLELLRLRAMTELRIRRVLNADQLATYVELRKRGFDRGSDSRSSR